MTSMSLSGGGEGVQQLKDLDPIKDKEQFEKARYILALGTPPSNRVAIHSLQQTAEGYYRAGYSEVRPGRTENSAPIDDTALLDLNFPFAKEDVKTLIDRYSHQPDLELFLSFGPGELDYPRTTDNDPREGARVFIVVDEAFGRARDKDKEQSVPLSIFNHHLTSRNVRHEKPQRTYLFNGLPFDTVRNAFDITQAINVISEPRIFSDPPNHIESLASVIKPGTGKLFLCETSTSDAYPLKRVKREVEQLGYSMEVLFHVPEPPDEVPEDQKPRLSEVLPEALIQKLQSEYHVNPAHFPNSTGGYAVEIHKPVTSRGVGPRLPA